MGWWWVGRIVESLGTSALLSEMQPNAIIGTPAPLPSSALILSSGVRWGARGQAGACLSMPMHSFIGFWNPTLQTLCGALK
jgi:hypothetical protein